MILSGTASHPGGGYNPQGEGDTLKIGESVKALEDELWKIRNKLLEEDKAMVERIAGASRCPIDASRPQLQCRQRYKSHV